MNASRLALLVLLFAVCGCEKSSDINTGERSSPPPDELGSPSDYFPTDTGRTWKYTVTLPSKEGALYYRVVNWPRGDTMTVTATRGLVGRLHGGEKTSGNLVLRVEGPAETQGPLQFPRGVKIRVVEDELGIYIGVKDFYWAILEHDGFKVNEILMFDPSSPFSGAPSGAWEHWNQELGYSHRVVFFGTRPGTAIGVGRDGEKDLLHFKGPWTGGGSGKSLYFQRIVAEDVDRGIEGGYLDQRFSEDLWFEKNVGLTGLHQDVGGVTTMTWSLVR